MDAITARELITRTLRLAGVTASGETPSATDLADSLGVLNEMLDEWNTERLLAYTVTRAEYTLTSNKDSYTIGPGGDFDTVRPVRIEEAYVKISTSGPNTELPLKIIYDEEYADIPVKTVTSSIPRKIYNNGDFPLSTLYLWPIPSVANTLILYTWEQFSNVASLDTSLTFPPGYMSAIRYNLADRLALEFGFEASASIKEKAVTTRAKIKSNNISPVYMDCDPGILSTPATFNWLTGE